MILNIRHQSVCRYERPVHYTVQQLRLTPRAESTQRALYWHIRAPGQRRELTDAWGNVAHLLTLDEPHDELRITVEGAVETADAGGYLVADPGVVSPRAYLADTPLTASDPAIAEFARRHFRRDGHRVRGLLDLIAPICEKVVHVAAPGEVALTAAQALAAGRGGGCDHAHVFIACCRASGIPARFVSGYVHPAHEGASAAHAWADAWIEGFGWLSFDVTRQRLADGAYCRLAVGRDHRDACPVRTVRRGLGEERIEVTVGAARPG